jgi:phosphoglycerate kinase
MKKSIEQVDVEGKFVLMRADFNVPVDAEGRITDDRRITRAMPTIRHILDHDGRLVLMSHLGRPNGKPDPKFSLAPVAQRLTEVLGQDVPLITEYTGDSPPAEVRALRKGQVALLENLRFNPEETLKDSKSEPPQKILKRQFARKIADLGEVYVNDAFGTCHRDNASMVTVPTLMTDHPRVTGLLVQDELRALGDIMASPQRPFVCILGGAKVSDKIALIEALLDQCDAILVGGAMAYTFMQARDEGVGRSLVESDAVGTARRLLTLAGEKLRLPVDHVCAAKLDSATSTVVCVGQIKDDLIGLDIGPQTLAGYADILTTAKTIIWNGPMGVFEKPPFDHGTMQLAEALARATDQGATSVVGGGDSASAIYRSGVQDRISHVSTGGGATLEFLEGKAFEAIALLDDA